ncbi:hypothetical protein STEG23_016926 [Scotinomys teguina]
MDREMGWNPAILLYGNTKKKTFVGMIPKMIRRFAVSGKDIEFSPIRVSKKNNIPLIDNYGFSAIIVEIWVELDQELLDREPPFLEGLRMRKKDLYVVTEAFEVTMILCWKTVAV